MDPSHRLGRVSVSAVTVAVAVGLVVLLGGEPARARAHRVLDGRASARPDRGPDRRLELPLAAAAAAGIAVLVGGSTGVLLGAVTASGSVWVLRRSVRRDRAREAAQLMRSLPLAGDLLAACIAAGAAPTEALAEVARAVDGPLSSTFAGVVRAVTLGVRPDEAWAPYVADGPPAALRTVAAALVRTSVSGASPGPVLESLARDLREGQRLAGEAAARRAGVVMVAPLGLCFLPAFVLIGVVPLVAGLIGSTLSSL